MSKRPLNTEGPAIVLALLLGTLAIAAWQYTKYRNGHGILYYVMQSDTMWAFKGLFLAVPVLGIGWLLWRALRDPE